MSNFKNLRIQEAADYLGVSSKTLRRWESNGKLIAAVRTKGNQRIYSLSQLDSFKLYHDKIKYQEPQTDNQQQISFPTPQPFKIDYLKYGFVFAVVIGILLTELTGGKSLKSFPLPSFNRKDIVGINQPLLGSDFNSRVLAETTEVEPFFVQVSVPATFEKAITAPNLVTEESAGSGIDISFNDEGLPIVSNTMPSFSSIAVSGQTSLSPSSTKSILTLAGSGGISVTTSTTDNKVTISASSSSLNVSGWTDGGTDVYLQTITDEVGIGTSSPSYNLHVVGTGYFSGATTLASTLSVTGAATFASTGDFTGALNLTGNSLTSTADLTIDPTGGGVKVGTGTPGSVDLAGDDLYVTGDMEVAGTIYGSVGGSVDPGFTVGSVVFQGASGLAQDNSNFFWNDSNNRLGIGTSAPAAAFDLQGNGRIGTGYNFSPSVDLGADLGTTDLRFNNIYAANLDIDSGFTSAAQLLVTYNPTDTTFSQSSIRVNVTTPAANEQMLGIGQAGEERAAVDAEGDITLGYDGAAGSSVPESAYPFSVYGHNTTNVSFIDTSGGSYFAGNMGIGVTSPAKKLEVVDTSAAQMRLTYTAGTYYTDFQTTSAGNLYINPSGTLVGIGTTSPGATLHLLDTTEQLRLGYDASNYLSFTVGSTGNLTLADSGTTIGTFGSEQASFAVPTEFQAAGDISVAYDIILTNQNSSNIISWGPLQIESGESFENNNLTLKTYGTGDVHLNMGGNLNLLSADPAIVFDTLTATDTDFWMGITEDAGGDDDDVFQIGEGIGIGTSAYLTINTSGYIGIGTTYPGKALGIVGGVGIGTTDSFANAAIADNNLAVQGSVGIGTTSPYSSTSTLGVVGGIAIGTTATYSNKQTPTGGLLVEGNVGIGTTIPGTKLGIVGGVGIGTTDSFANAAIAANNLAVQGSVGVGTTSPSYPLHVVGNTQITGDIYSDNTSGSADTFTIYSGTVAGANSTFFRLTSNTGASININGNTPLSAGQTSVTLGYSGITTINFGITNTQDVNVRADSWTFDYDTNFALSGGNNGLSFDTDTLSIDAASDRIGIGTTAPGTKLGVAGGVGIGTTDSFANAAIATNNLAVQGSVGIGVTSPQSLLDISSTAPTFRMSDTTASAKSLLVTTDANLTKFSEAAGTDILTLDLANSRLGIGTTSPGTNLGIVGGVGIGTTDSFANAAIASKNLAVQGYIGIGVTSPGTDLEIVAGTNPGISFETSTIKMETSASLPADASKIGGNTSQLWIDTDTLFLRSEAGGTRITLTSTGLGLGTTSPGTKLGIVGGVGIGTTDSFANAAIAANNTAIQGDLGIGTTSPTMDLDIVNGVAYSRVNAGDANWTASSSRDIKENLQLVDGIGILEKISTVPVYTFNYIGGPENKMGLIAEDFFTVFGRGSDKEINYQEVTMALWLGIQELNKTINNLGITADPQQPTVDQKTLENLVVAGQTTLGDTTITGNLTAGLIQIDGLNNTLNATGNLQIQSLLLGNIEFLGGLIKMDIKGNLEIKEGVVLGNDNFRGSETLAVGQTSIHIDKVWDSPPVSVTVTPTYNTIVWVENIIATGFDIKVSNSPIKDEKINWMAIW